MKRKLTLRSETLTELDPGLLRGLGAGDAPAATNMSSCCPEEVISRLLGTCGICSAFTDGCEARS